MLIKFYWKGVQIMSKENFIDELRIKLKRLSKEEVDNVVAYYLEYFDDAEKDEAEVI
ncbi:HAAS signaling domain-containing protein, partial [Clostridium perfringens]|uniref:HAAS signaling domain-containing protein n=1 Tax=Clostridium perfringens TaxID=1502 RepID=UPI003A102625